MDSGEAASIVSIVGFALSMFGANIDPALITGAVQGVFAVIAFATAVWSWYSHRTKNATLAGKGL